MEQRDLGCLQDLVTGFPALRSVRIQINILFNDPVRPDQMAACVDRVMRRAALFGKVEVKVFLEKYSYEDGTPAHDSILSIIHECQKRLNQRQTKPC